MIAFVFSGHGGTSVAPDSYLGAWDSAGGVMGEDGDLWDWELADILQTANADRIFVFLDACYSGGMCDNLMSMPNNGCVYTSSACSDTGCTYDEPTYQNGAWTYWFLEAGLGNNFGSNPDTTMEDCFDWADSQYNPGGNDEPMEFDGNSGEIFTLW